MSGDPITVDFAAVGRMSTDLDDGVQAITKSVGAVPAKPSAGPGANIAGLILDTVELYACRLGQAVSGLVTGVKGSMNALAATEESAQQKSEALARAVGGANGTATVPPMCRADGAAIPNLQYMMSGQGGLTSGPRLVPRVGGSAGNGPLAAPGGTSD